MTSLFRNCRRRRLLLKTASLGRLGWNCISWVVGRFQPGYIHYFCPGSKLELEG